MRRGPRWFVGSADAIYQNFNLIRDERPDHIIVFGADHIYRMDPRQMVERAHRERRRGHGGGDPRADRSGRSVRRDRDRAGRPARSRRSARSRPTPSRFPTRPIRCTRRWATTCSATDALVEAVTTDAKNEASRHDIGGNLIPMLVERGEARVYDFATNEVPGADRARPRLLARRGDARCVLRRAHGPDLGDPGLQPLQPRVADSHVARSAAAGQVRVRRGRPTRARARLDGVRRCCPLGRGRRAARSCRPASTCTPTPRSRTRS